MSAGGGPARQGRTRPPGSSTGGARPGPAPLRAISRDEQGRAAGRRARALLRVRGSPPATGPARQARTRQPPTCDIMIRVGPRLAGPVMTPGSSCLLWRAGPGRAASRPGPCAAADSWRSRIAGDTGSEKTADAGRGRPSASVRCVAQLEEDVGPSWSARQAGRSRTRLAAAGCSAQARSGAAFPGRQ